jgi:hypothetical protein
MAEVSTWAAATSSLANKNLWTVRALTIMSFSFSTFTIEIDGVPAIAFRAKWYAEADDICRGWANLNWDEIVANDPAGCRALPPTVTVRLARAPEKAAYDAAVDDLEFYGDVKIVELADPADRRAGTDASILTENVTDNAACIELPRRSFATQSPAQSFVPSTVPTSLDPMGTVGFTCTNGFAPTFGEGA